MAASQAIAAPSPLDAPPETRTGERRRYLYGPVTDFLCMGGSTLFLLPLLLLTPPMEYQATIAFTAVVLNQIVNQPHFIHSYQIFYRGFRAKIAAPDYSRAMRLRYVFAGIVVPIVLALYLAGSALAGNARLLGLAANAMYFFVGWHYVKQGYGMLMADAALKRQFFTAADKRILLVNSYAVWIYAWLLTNSLFREGTYAGLKYFAFPIPSFVVTAALAIAVVSTVATLAVLARRWAAHGRSLPYNGIVGYVASLYVWLLFGWTNPLWIVLVPALHSLQYLVVVWRFETNYERGQADAGEEAPLPVRRLWARFGAGALLKAWLGARWQWRFAVFVLVGLVLGFLAFRGVPILLNKLVPYDREILGVALFGFVITVFVNIHHYFLDNVMWRRENPDTRRYLFA